VDRLPFHLSWGTGDRAFMGRSAYVAKMLSEIRERFGTGGEKIVYDEGYAWGKESLAEMTARMGGEFVLSNLENVMMLYQAQGWFKVERVERNERTGAVMVDASENFECMGEKSKRPHSQFVRGHLAGAFTAILGTEMACVEKRCIAAGGRLCEFALSPRPNGGATTSRRP